MKEGAAGPAPRTLKVLGAVPLREIIYTSWLHKLVVP